MTAIPLSNRVILITGAAGRLGRRMVAAFAEQGAIIAAVGREKEALHLPDGSRGSTFGIDMTDEAQVKTGFERIAEDFGRIDTVVHTVGMWEGSPLAETPLTAWRRILDVNLTSTFLCLREAARNMGERGGQLIAMASGQGADGAVKEQGPYSAAKAGVIRLVEAVSKEYAAAGITAHAIAPSFIRYGESEQRGVEAEELVKLVVYLSDPKASMALNGATIRAYGTLQ